MILLIDAWPQWNWTIYQSFLSSLLSFSRQRQRSRGESAGVNEREKRQRWGAEREERREEGSEREETEMGCARSVCGVQ